MAHRVRIGDLYKIKSEMVLPVPTLTCFFIQGLIILQTVDQPHSLQRFTLPHFVKLPSISLPVLKKSISDLKLVCHWVVATFANDPLLYVFDEFENSWQTLESHLSGITCLSVSESFLVSGSQDMTIRVWNPQPSSFQPHQNHILLGHSAPLTCLQTHQQYLLSAASDNQLLIWRSSKLQVKLQFPSSIVAIESCGQSNQIVVYELNNRITILDASKLPSKLIESCSTIKVNESCLSTGIRLKQLDDCLLIIANREELSFMDMNLNQIVSTYAMSQRILAVQVTGRMIMAAVHSGVMLLSI